MNLTREDLAAIQGIVDAKVDALEVKVDAKFERLINEEITPFRNAFRQMLGAHVEFVENIELIEANVNLIISHMGLAPRARNLRNTLQKIS